MTLTETEIHERLVESENYEQIELKDDLTESNIKTWLGKIDVEKIKTEAENSISRAVLSDLDEQATESATLREVIKSRNDNPSEFTAGYVIRANKTYVQYFKPNVGGKVPMDKQTAQAELDSHIQRLVDNALAAELLSRAKTEFTV